MQLQHRLDTDADAQTELVRVVDGWYEVEEDGWQRPMPVLHYHGRTEGSEYRHWAVEGFRPYFYVAASDVDEDDLGALDADRRVVDIRAADRTGIGSGTTGISLIRIEVECPWHVKELRSEFPRTWEADVLFPQRFLIDRGISSYCRLPADETRVAPEDVESADPDTTIQPRVCMWDIEVQHDGDSMPDPNAPRHPISAVTLHDSATDEYATVVLRGDEGGELASPSQSPSETATDSGNGHVSSTARRSAGREASEGGGPPEDEDSDDGEGDRWMFEPGDEGDAP